jgi:hypothetical protein
MAGVDVDVAGASVTLVALPERMPILHPPPTRTQHTAPIRTRESTHSVPCRDVCFHGHCESSDRPTLNLP